jgi:hypothetical protein
MSSAVSTIVPSRSGSTALSTLRMPSSRTNVLNPNPFGEAATRHRRNSDVREPQLAAARSRMKRPDRLVGTWSIERHVVGSDEMNIRGETTFRWLPGGCFLEQHGPLDSWVSRSTASS